jgi:hypothetical protein
MSNVQIDQGEVHHEVEKRKSFWAGVFRHFAVFLVINVIVWPLWTVLVKDPSAFPVPLVITGGWAIVLLVHAIIVFASHKPSEVAQDEVERQAKDQQVMGRRG